jgi:hypothetical protein
LSLFLNHPLILARFGWSLNIRKGLSQNNQISNFMNILSDLLSCLMLLVFIYIYYIYTYI